MATRDLAAIIDELAVKGTAELESFFISQGLGAAFTEPSKGWGRRKRINEALLSAEKAGNLDTVLRSAVKRFDLKSPEQNQPAKRSSASSRRAPPRGGKAWLATSISDAEADLVELVESGTQLRDRLSSADSVDVFERAVDQYSAWGELVHDVLGRLFSTDELSKTFSRVGVVKKGGGAGTWKQRRAVLLKSLSQRIAWLEKLVGNLAYYESLSRKQESTRKAQGADDEARAKRGAITQAPSIFLVHGHDMSSKETVARFLERVTGLNVVVLHEQPNRGQTIIEKFEGHARSADFAVVLLTGDDVGGRSGKKDLHARGRQNVVFELGFFVAALGRERVAVLVGLGVERPSDIHGLVYIGLDGDWRRELARELDAAGLQVHVSKL